MKALEIFLAASKNGLLQKGLVQIWLLNHDCLCLFVKAAQTWIEAGENLNWDEADWRHEVRRAVISSPILTASPSGSSASLDPHAAHLEDVLMELFSLLNNQTLVRRLWTDIKWQFVPSLLWTSVVTNSKNWTNTEYRIYSYFENASNTEYRIYSVPENSSNMNTE